MTDLKTLLSDQSEWGSFVRVWHADGRDAGIVAFQRAKDALYVSRIDTLLGEDEIQSLYYSVLEKVKAAAVALGIPSVFVVPLYGYGERPYNDSLQYLSSGNNYPSLNLTYTLLSKEKGFKSVAQTHVRFNFSKIIQPYY